VLLVLWLTEVDVEREVVKLVLVVNEVVRLEDVDWLTVVLELVLKLVVVERLVVTDVDVDCETVVLVE